MFCSWRLHSFAAKLQTGYLKLSQCCMQYAGLSLYVSQGLLPASSTHTPVGLSQSVPLCCAWWVPSSDQHLLWQASHELPLQRCTSCKLHSTSFISPYDRAHVGQSVCPDRQAGPLSSPPHTVNMAGETAPACQASPTALYATSPSPCHPCIIHHTPALPPANPHLLVIRV